jgi:hypothetical protein
MLWLLHHLIGLRRHDGDVLCAHALQVRAALGRVAGAEAVVIVGVGCLRPSTSRGRRPIVSIPLVYASPHYPKHV